MKQKQASQWDPWDAYGEKNWRTFFVFDNFYRHINDEERVLDQHDHIKMHRYRADNFEVFYNIYLCIKNHTTHETRDVSMHTSCGMHQSEDTTTRQK
jgi:hypothetical protein